jgi:hypothetical protein
MNTTTIGITFAGIFGTLVAIEIIGMLSAITVSLQNAVSF